MLSNERCGGKKVLSINIGYLWYIFNVVGRFGLAGRWLVNFSDSKEESERGKRGRGGSSLSPFSTPPCKPVKKTHKSKELLSTHCSTFNKMSKLKKRPEQDSKWSMVID